MSLNNVIRSDRGFATLIALIMVTMLTLIGIAALSTSDDEVTIAGNELQEMRAFYAAEAGLERPAAIINKLFDSTGVAPSLMPSGTEFLNQCTVTYASTDNGAATQKTLSSGTLSGLHALVKSFSLKSTAVSSIDNARVSLTVAFESALVPIFQFAVFYDDDLEIAPGPVMSLIGRVHTNSDLYLQAGAEIRMDSYVTSAGDIYHGRKGPGGGAGGDVLIKDAYGNYQSMQDGGGWLDSPDAHWYDSSVARWQGRVQDATHGQSELNVPINGTSDDPHKLIEPEAGNPDSYEAKATLKFVDGQAYRKMGGVWSDVTADMVSKGIITFATDQFYDQRESEWVDVMDLDVDKMYDESYGPSNGVIYFSDEPLGSDWPAMRMTNGSELDGGLTVASENPIYTVGDYNSVNKKPAAILADAITFLSGAWDDTKSNLDKSNRHAVTTNVNASLITGNVETTPTDYNGGFENLPRFLEVWSGVNFNWTGSMVNLWESLQANGLWSGSFYAPPNRNWTYDTDLDDPANMPPETPVVRVFQKTGWRQEHVGLDH